MGGGCGYSSVNFQKKKRGKKKPDKAKQVEQTSVFALQMCAETTRRALQGKMKRESLVKWPLHPPPAEPPLIVLLSSVVYGWVGGGRASGPEPRRTCHGLTPAEIHAPPPPRILLVLLGSI